MFSTCHGLKKLATPDVKDRLEAGFKYSEGEGCEVCDSRSVVSNQILPVATIAIDVATKTLQSPLLSKSKRYTVYLLIDIHFLTTVYRHI